MKKLWNLMLSRVVITGLLVLAQMVFFAVEVWKLSTVYVYIALGLRILSVIVVAYIICQTMNPSVKLAWIVPIMMFPLFGGLMYLLFGHVILPKKLQKNFARAEQATRDAVRQPEGVWEEIMEKDPGVGNQCRYLWSYALAPVWKNTKSSYFKVGEEFFEDLLVELEKAESFIFMEYFIVQEGKMWNSIHEILKRKAREGVDVRFMYDDMGCAFTLPKKYYEVLDREGIQCIDFNRIIPFMAIILNNRDHRKITVIDGKVAYTGGLNLADEYINEKVRFGHWKDTALKVEGDAVWSFTVMFLTMWNGMRLTDDSYEAFHYKYAPDTFQDGYVLPYGDTPLDHEVTGESVYMNIVNSAKRYVYIYTPYLITDNEMLTSLKLAAKRGVDVRIVTPGIPDKKMAYALTQSYYERLIEAGVRIFQYTPGFIHAKCFLCDDEIATVGTINLDYRSLYHHFECGCFLYQTSVTKALYEDMANVFEVSEEIDKAWCESKNVVRMGIIAPILKLFAPLM